jgi:hypothetical protein
MIAVLLLLASGLAFGAGGARAEAPFSVTVTSSASAPGMLMVRWTADPAEPWILTYIVTWWRGTDTAVAPAGSVVLSPYNRVPETPLAAVIPSLEDGATYTVEVTSVVMSGTGPVLLNSVEDTEVVAGSTPTCETGRLCGTLADSPGSLRTVSVYTGGTNGMATVEGSNFRWSPPSEWPTDNPTTGGGWTTVTMQIVDRSGISATRWWSAFGDPGVSYETATAILLPSSGPSVNVGTIAATAGTLLTGELRKELPGGGSAPLTASDFVDLCIDVIRISAAGPQSAATMCGFRDFGFGSDLTVPGKWRISLPPGTYRIRFIDRPNYFGTSNVLLYNVNFAPQWWRADGARGESPSTASLFDLPAGTPGDLSAVLRPAKQVRVDVTGIPASVDLTEAWASVSIVDEQGNWTGGAMTIDAVARTASASVTGLVEGRPYRIFLRFEGSGGSFYRWWLVGGGTLDSATGIVPGPVVVEPWQTQPLLVSLHRPDGNAYGPGEACIALAPAASPGDEPAASSCVGSNYVALLQRVPAGTYRVVAYRRDPDTGETIGSPIRLADFEVTNDLPTAAPFFPDFAIGVSDTSRLAGGASITPPFSPLAAVVLP